MTRILSILFILAMVVQLIRPFGVAGLRRRADFWKIGVGALVVVGLAATFQPH